MLSTFYEKISFALKNMVRADIFPVLWQFGKSAAKPPRLPACLARLRRARQAGGRSGFAAFFPNRQRTEKIPAR